MSNTDQQFQDDTDQINYLANEPLQAKASPLQAKASPLSQPYNEPPPMNGTVDLERKPTLHRYTNYDAGFYIRSGLTDNKSMSSAPPSGTGLTYNSSA